MIEIVLPYLYNNGEFYKTLNYLSKNNKLFTQIKFTHLYGNFPWSFWHGNKNTNTNNNIVILEENIKTFNKKSEFPLILDISNNNLSEYDLKDNKLNMILKELNNGANKVSCSDLNIMSILQNNYPYYDYIFSENASLNFPFTNEIVDTILEQENIKSIILNKYLIDEKFNFSSIKYKQKVYIKIGNNCENNCPNYIQCLKKENELQYLFSNNSVFNSCDKVKKLYNNFSLKEEIEYYKKLGYTKFILDSPLAKIPLNIYNLYLLLNLKKDNDDSILKEVYLNLW